MAGRHRRGVPPQGVGLHECPHCHYRFEDAEALRRHLEEGRGCPEMDEQRAWTAMAP